MQAVPPHHAVQLTHGLTAAAPLLQAVAGGRVPAATAEDPDRTVDVRPVRRDEISTGVVVGDERHLATVLRGGQDEGFTTVVRSERLAALFADRGWPSPFADLLNLPRRILELPADVLETMRLKSGPIFLGWLLNVEEIPATTIAAAFHGPADAQHLLRCTVTDRAGQVVGGYSLVVM
jgi:hypothetical protein